MPDDTSSTEFLHDYDAIEAAVLETPRGRWFLREFASRNRAADTGAVLEAIAKLQSAMGRDGAQEPSPSASDVRDGIEAIQESAWALRNAGSDPRLCDELDRHARDLLRVSRRHDLAIGSLRNTLRELVPADAVAGVEPTGLEAEEASRPDAPAQAGPAPALTGPGNPWAPGVQSPRTLAEIEAWDIRDKLRLFT